jgi:hypothetical protein
MDVTFATTDVHPRDRLDYWREVACRAFVDLECDTPRRRAFRAKIRSGPFADLGLSVVESDPCEVRRTPQGIARSSGDAVLLSVQMAGSSVLTQDGRQAPLGPGDFALYDTRRPYTLDVHAGTARLVLKIPAQGARGATRQHRCLHGKSSCSRKAIDRSGGGIPERSGVSRRRYGAVVRAHHRRAGPRPRGSRRLTGPACRQPAPLLRGEPWRSSASRRRSRAGCSILRSRRRGPQQRRASASVAPTRCSRARARRWSATS